MPSRKAKVGDEVIIAGKKGSRPHAGHIVGTKGILTDVDNDVVSVLGFVKGF